MTADATAYFDLVKRLREMEVVCTGLAARYWNDDWIEEGTPTEEHTIPSHAAIILAEAADALEQAHAKLEMERANHAACTRLRLQLEDAREDDIARLEEALAEIAALKAQREAPCPHVRTGKDGTSYCELAQATATRGVP
jgi:hypothetical protein